MLEFDGQPMDPAIVSAQPMKPAQSMDVPQMVCPPGMFDDIERSCTIECGNSSCVLLKVQLLQFTPSPGQHNPTLFQCSLSPHK